MLLGMILQFLFFLSFLLLQKALNKATDPETPPERRQRAWVGYWILVAVIGSPPFLYLIYLVLIAFGFYWDVMFDRPFA